MITVEIAFNCDKVDFLIPPDIQIGVDFDRAMRSDKSPSRWSDAVFSKLSGILVHVFDKKFVNSRGYRALYDDIEDVYPRFLFPSDKLTDFLNIVELCLKTSSDSNIYICTDTQFGPYGIKFKPMTYKKFVKYCKKFGLRLNSCINVTM